MLDHMLRIHVDSYTQVEVDDYYKEMMGRVQGNIRGLMW